MVKTAKADGIEMQYITFGNGDRQMVIIPGLSIKSVMESDEAICQAYNTFTEEFTVYLFDRKEGVTQGYTIEQMADDTAVIMKSLNIKNACVFGVSQGGMIAMSLAGRYPELVDRLFAGSTCAKSNAVIEKTCTQWKKLAGDGDKNALARDVAMRIFSDKTLENCLDYIVSIYSDVTTSELEKFAFLADACVGFDISGDAAKITCPVLIAGCEGDKIITVQALKETAVICKAQVYMYGSEYGHGVYDEAGDYRSRIYNFFTAERK